MPAAATVSTPTPESTATLSSTSTPVPILPPHLRHIEEKQYMLELINDERIWAGLDPVVLGDNIAAQLHSDAALENCFSSHWGIDGLKPYMRYSLAGGYQSNGENGSGLDYCITSRDGYQSLASIEQEIRETMDGWMDSLGHQRNILDSWHKKVNIGIAWDRYNFKAIQHFEGDYVDYESLPSIENGILSVEGTVKDVVTVKGTYGLGLQIYYDAPPHMLTRGQVARTYCYDSGLLVAALRRPLTGSSYSYSEDNFQTRHDACPNPYDVPSSVDAPSSPNEATASWRAALYASQGMPSKKISVPWITARYWDADEDSFEVRADLSNLLAEHGRGVYSLLIWGKIRTKDVVISQYSIFHDVVPPDTYSAR